MRKGKKIIITITILLIILGIIFYILYQTTDYFKSKQQLFWKYAVQNSDVVNLFNNEPMNEIKKQKINNPYTTTSNFYIKVNNTNYTVDMKTNAKNANDVFSYVELKQNGNNIIDFNLVKKSNVVGIKMDELANGYITLKNSNLKDLAEKIGIEDKDKIPDNINWGTYIDILEISEEDKEYITEKYSNVILSNTNKKNYSKGESIGIKINDKIHTGVAYKITLTENESKKILSDIFMNLSTDSRTLNLISSKMKMLNFSAEHTQINRISSKFSEISERINEIETTDDDFIEITVYVENSSLLQTNIKIKDEKLIKIVYDKESNKINIKQELLNKNQNNNKFILTISDALNKVCEQVQEINISNEVSEDKKMISTKMEIFCQEDINILYESTTKIVDSVEENNDYDNSLKIILNDLTEKQLKNLYKAVLKTIPSIYNDKQVIISGGTTQSEENTQVESNNQNE